jgi:hypothetical protein
MKDWKDVLYEKTKDEPLTGIFMTIKEIKRELKLTDADIAEMFGYKNAVSYSNSARKHHIESGIVSLYQVILDRAVF